MTLTVSEHRYEPRGSARELFYATDPEIVIAGPAGTGKSRACLEKLHAMCLRYKGMRALIVRKTLASLADSALKTYREIVAAESINCGHVTYYGGSAQEAAQYRYTNGSKITIGGMNYASRIMSTEYDLIFVEEATELDEDDWEHLTTRLRNYKVPFQQIIGACNPDKPTHFIKMREHAGRLRLMESRHTENPEYYDADGKITQRGEEYVEGILARKTGIWRNRFYLGIWAAAEGLIYDDFDDSIHIIKKFRPPSDWTRYWAVDFGYTNPFVLQFWAEDPDGRLYLYREIYQTQRTVDLHVKLALAHVIDAEGKWTEPRPRAIICDHDAEGRAQLERDLHIATTPAHKKVLEGIQAVQKRLVSAGDGKPRLFIMQNSLIMRDTSLDEAKKPASTMEEITGYVWNDKVLKEAPVKEDDHGMDSLRYMVAFRDLGQTPAFRGWVDVR